jgi:DNA-binding CsgD family transcriptional regulator
MENVNLEVISTFINSCHNVRNLQDFHNFTYPILKKVLPHKMFSCGTLCINNTNVIDSININFPNEIFNDTLTSTCPVLSHWIDIRSPVHLDSNSSLGSKDKNTLSYLFKQHEIENLAMHGVVDLNNKYACYFYFGGVDCWTEHEKVLLKLLIPQLFYALIHIEDYGNVRPKNIITLREKEVLSWICKGKSNSEVAMILAISPWTVKIHVSNLMTKLNASNRVHAVAKAIDYGFIEA